MRGLNVSSREAVWATVWMVLTTGAFQTGFALKLGATPFWLGLLAAIPAAVGLLQIPASLWVRGARRRFVAFSALAGRLCWGLILALPFVLPASARLPVFALLLLLSSALLTITVPAWTSWISDLVPATSRGQYFARRNLLAGLVAMLVPLPAGAFLDQAVRYHRFSPYLAFAILFGLACLAGGVAFVLILRQPEPPLPEMPDARRAGFFQSLRQPLAESRFRAYLLFAGLMVAGQTLAGQFFLAWQVSPDALNLPYLTVQVLGALASGAGLASGIGWGFLADRYGARPVLGIACAGVISAPLLWMLTVPGPSALTWNIGVIVVINLISGAFWAGVGLTQFNLMIAITPAESRGTFVAVSSAFTGMIGGVAPLLGGVLMELLATLHLSLGPLLLNNYKTLFLLTAILRVACLIVLTRLPDSEGRSARYVVEQLRASRPVTSFLTLRKLSRPSAEDERARAVETLGDLRSPLAVEELTAALDDISAEVRHRAVRALTEIRDARAVPALCAKLSDPAAGIGEEAATALAAIGDERALPALTEALRGPDALVRLFAARAIGQIGSAKGASALVEALDPTHPSVVEAAADGLASLAAALPAQTLAAARDRLLPLLSPEYPRGLRLAAARALETVLPRVADNATVNRVTERVSAETDATVAAQLAASVVQSALALDLGPVRVLPFLRIGLRRARGGPPLAFKTALNAVGSLGLGSGAFYPYLGLAEMERDETAQRLLNEARQHLNTIARQSRTDKKDTAQRAQRQQRGLMLNQRIGRALEAYTESRYAETLTLLARLSRQLPPTRAAGRRAAVVLQQLAEFSDESPDDTRPEEGLLGVFLFRVVVGDSTSADQADDSPATV